MQPNKYQCSDGGLSPPKKRMIQPIQFGGINHLIEIYTVYIYIYNNILEFTLYSSDITNNIGYIGCMILSEIGDTVPVVPHKAVAEVSKIGNL